MEIRNRGDGTFGWTDGEGSELRWQTAFASPKLRVWYAEGDVKAAALVPTVHVRAVVVLRHVEGRDNGGRTLVRHQADLIVHTDFGIGRYAGLTKMQVQGVPGDFLVLEYAGKDKIYLPVSRMRLIQKFTGGDPANVQLDKLGTASWSNRTRPDSSVVRIKGVKSGPEPPLGRSRPGNSITTSWSPAEIASLGLKASSAPLFGLTKTYSRGRLSNFLCGL